MAQKGGILMCQMETMQSSKSNNSHLTLATWPIDARSLYQLTFLQEAGKKKKNTTHEIKLHRERVRIIEEKLDK